MQLKRTLASIIVSSIIICNTQVVQASENNQIDTITEDNVNESLISVDDLNTQLDKLYSEVSENVGLDKEYIKQLHILAGGQAIYADKRPNIYMDETSQSLKAPMELYEANTVYQKAEFIDCEDDKIERPSAYYLPDAVYTVAYDIYALMSQRYYYNREGYQIYFDTLKDDIKQRIIFYESVLLYTGESEEKVNNLFMAYEKILYDKQSNENVIEKDNEGRAIIKDKFLDIINDIGITDETRLGYLAIILSFDADLAESNNVENIKDEYIVPYRLNYTSRENMMIAASSLTGKVRYVWGGGHSGASYIDGINPVWAMWNELYPKESNGTDEEGNEVHNTGYGTCIKPSGSWCPVHGASSGECNKSEKIHSLDEYIALRAETFDTTELQDDKYRELLSKVDYTNGISVHTLDGLDCSGFASWLYNQITDRYEINSTAVNFVDQYGLTPLEFDSDLLPGDVFAWTEHIVIIVGKVRDGSKAYVTIEQTPNVLKYGVVYYSGASNEDIKNAEQIAAEANILIGGITSEIEKPHAYCMDTKGYYTEMVTETVTEEHYYSYDEPIDEEYWQYDEEGNLIEESTYYTVSGTYYEDVEVTNEVLKQEHELGRFKDNFIDENMCVGEDNKLIKDMTAQEIIQYTLTKLPISYVSGYNLYEGDLFNKSLVSSNLGVTLVDTKQDIESGD